MVFVQVVIVLAEVIFSFNEEERGGLRRVGGVNLSQGKVLLKKIFSDLLSSGNNG